MSVSGDNQQCKQVDLCDTDAMTNNEHVRLAHVSKVGEVVQGNMKMSESEGQGKAKQLRVIKA